VVSRLSGVLVDESRARSIPGLFRKPRDRKGSGFTKRKPEFE
jgi:hypothetical protein